MKWWKIAGLAGMAGVAATGVAVARAQRQRNAYTPDEVHDRLRRRAAEAGVVSDGSADSGTGPAATTEGNDASTGGDER